MSKNTFKTYICKPYCAFFKDGEKEEMACQGAIILERLTQKKLISPSNLNTEPIEKDASFKKDETLLRLVCGRCPFEAQDCDFRSNPPPEGSVPCGGYILLYLLKSKKLLTIQDIEEGYVEKS